MSKKKSAVKCEVNPETFRHIVEGVLSTARGQLLLCDEMDAQKEDVDNLRKEFAAEREARMGLEDEVAEIIAKCEVRDRAILEMKERLEALERKQASVPWWKVWAR